MPDIFQPLFYFFLEKNPWDDPIFKKVYVIEHAVHCLTQHRGSDRVPPGVQCEVVALHVHENCL